MAGGRSRGTATLIAVAVVLGWLVIGALAGPYSGKLGEVATNNNAAFLPTDAEATRAQKLFAGFVAKETIPALVVYERSSGLTGADDQRVAADVARFAQVPGVVSPLPPPIPSRDDQALQVIVPIDSSEGEQVRQVVDRLRDIAGNDRDGLTVDVAGPAGLLADLIEVFTAIDGPLLLVTLVVVLIILLIVYRSPVLWIFPLLAAGMSYSLASVFVYYLAENDVITLNGQAQGILTVLVFGAGTDYALLLIARYREELHRHGRPWDAMKTAWKGAAPAIIASGITVIVSLLCLLLSSLNSNRALGPVSAIGIAATLLVMLTFLPALLVLGGRWAFWPRTPWEDQAEPQAAHGIWGRIAGFVARRARVVWLVTAVVLAALTLGVTQLGATTLGQSDLFTNRTDSVAGQEVIARHYPAGTGSPATIFTRQETAQQIAQVAQGVPGVAAVRPVTQQRQAGPPDPNAQPKVVDGRVQLEATLADPPDSDGAERTIRDLRAAVHKVPGSDSVVGGFTAINVDTAAASTRDRNLIIPVVLVVIAIILALLLRALLAPVLLIATVLLSFLATLGLCALLFKYVFDFPGVDQSFPLFAFVFLVALGIDYNIFLMSRVREESVKRGTRAGVLAGLALTGGVITSAGIVLAATFSALAVLPLVVLVELGVAVAVGVLLDTIVVRSLLVPALAYDIGPKVWWPGRLSRTNRDGDRTGAELEPAR
ncbi:putative drug exporter of the RND superfamily [Micromonospora rhizosphaerae]|uniref:Putative drug exporter of the RND superfamily n=1 Tax=Micromonospora rhizosphaerae TaxID=568872 RepID=A0A1C6T986_9ACTN|nr:MMPL family transporter [Micromonospora rhizosphaerae]SCL38328.1 putative drug exporter of the RND superfamily [Micromonospora rhizosphaerae]